MFAVRQRCSVKLTRGFLLPRHASTSSNPYPYPTNAHPTPHQIFHLPRTATVGEVKARYYELVRIYHPDSPISRTVPPEKAHSRFQAVKAAYDALRGKTPLSATGEPLAPRRDYHDLSTAMWRAKQRRRADLNLGVDDKWKDRLMVSVVFLTLAAFVAQTYSTRRKALSETHERSNHARRPSTRPSEPSLDLALAPADENTKP